MQPTYRGRLPKPDKRGYYRPEVGGQRFNLGNKADISEGKAQRRLTALRDLFDLQCNRHETDRWEPWLIDYAKRLAKGERTVYWRVGRPVEGESPETHAAESASFVAELEALGFVVETDRPQTVAQGRAQMQVIIQEEVQRAVSEAIEKATEKTAGHFGPVTQLQASFEPESYETKSLHEALDAYSNHLKVTGDKDDQGNLKTRARKCMDRLRYLKQHHQDVPLWQLNLPELEKQAAYWRNRPKTAKGNRCSRDHATDMGKEQARFLRWLDKSPDFNWSLPKGASAIKRSPVKLPQDDNLEAFQTVTKDVYTPQQLAWIAKHADRFGQALIAVCVNCAFGQSEIGQWPTKKFQLYKQHPHQKKIGFASTDADSWIVGERPKTHFYGEYLLWPEVAKAIEPFLDGREVFPITRNRTPWYKTHTSNPQAKFTNWWNALVARTRKKHSEVPKLPFGSLRDILPDLLRRKYSDRVASLALHHGTLSEDELLKCYANLPFAELFEATRELHSHFKPLLEVLSAK